MSRRYDAASIVTLPVLKATEAHTLGTTLLTLADAVEVPANAQPSLGRFRGAVNALGAALAAVAPRQGYGPEVVVADNTVDGCWSGQYHWLDGWRRLPGGPESAQADAVIQDLYPTGLDFTQMSYRDQWAESELRIKRLFAKGHDQTVLALGGERFLTRLQAAHAAYGEALGVTAAGEFPEVNEANRREPLLAFLSALRGYVLKVAAHADPDVEGSEALVARLLAPLTALQPRPNDTRVIEEGVKPPVDEVPTA